MIQYVKGYAAQLEREKIRERTLRARRSKLQSGKPTFHGWQLYGYRPNREECRYEIVESEAIIVRRIFEMCAAGLGCHAIASTLNREGVPSPKVVYRGATAKWSAATLHRMLANSSYKGEEYCWRTERDKRKRDRARPECDWMSCGTSFRND